MESYFTHQQAETQPTAECAGKLFAQVSARYPASIASQAAAVALHCQKNNMSAMALGEELNNDEVQLRKLATQANNAHRRLSMSSQVCSVDVSSIVASVFTIGHLMQERWPGVFMQDIIALYSKIGKDRAAHDDLNEIINSMLDLNYVRPD